MQGFPTQEQAKENQIIVLVVEPGKVPYEKRIENDFRALQQLVGGGIEFVSLPEPDCHIYCNDEGKLRDCPETASRITEMFSAAPLLFVLTMARVTKFQ